ncbi:nuclear GTPase SLIP-GC-like isoform X2 [Betta splendens]|uniref:Nuclear GTPase SLIP-GC-like isoform X2 n=1 Tax=Betta splendens TaxID=158456 RepID=A0A8M1HGW9_BETSP|nr:nuclear GTPase SLIP-GC-like isoform X2 [Betta splendens]XP_055366965.1 nuclear GTPase SLIP-GC-like isoform X2 [Betta splendens]
MDNFVRNKLTEWGFCNLIERFEDKGIDKESLLCLEDHHIDSLIPKLGQRAKFTKRLKLLKEDSKTNCQEAEDVSNAGPSTSASSEKGNRALDLDGELQPPSKRQKPGFIGSNSEEIILSCGKSIMSQVHGRLHLDEHTKLNDFLKSKIRGLETDKRELIGVFGRSGAGKSSLINAVIEEFNLLPSGDFKACTSVMIKVEANMLNFKYEAEIEFILKEDWKDELWCLYNNVGDDHEIEDKLTALYGEEWRNKPPLENLLDSKYFKEIPEFLMDKKKFLTSESGAELSAKLLKYTISESIDEAEKRWYWPLVKCVTVRVPKNPLLQHVTLVDLPGNGDCNRSRNEMWKEFVGSCSTVWIVTDINRAASEDDAWEILESACSLIGNGGQCQQIHFICTKSEYSEKFDELSRDAVRGHIFKRNMKAKDEVQKKFNTLNNVKKHFNDGCFKVFTVSSKLFRKEKQSKPSVLQLDETEIPQLQKFLQNLNDCHSETLNFVSGAYGILSLMQGARSRDTADSKTEVCLRLEEKLQQEFQKIAETMKKTYKDFEECLIDGVRNSESSCEETLHRFLYPRQKGSGFHKTLSSVVERSGVHKRTKGKPINLNMKLSSKLTDSIDEIFRNTFPNEGKPFSEVINAFSLDTEKLIEKYKAVELQMIFLKIEEERIKTRLTKIIRDRKKTIYSSLTEMIEDTMQDGYKKAAKFRGKHKLKSMRETLKTHLHDSKKTMFKNAKRIMLQYLQMLMEEILETLMESLNEAIELSLKTDDHIIPDFSAELDQMKKYYKQLEESSHEESN